MTANKIRLLYAGYVVLITALFLYLQFPVQSTRNLLISGLKALHPDLKLAVVEIKPILPPALKLQKVDISYMHNPLVEISEMKIGPILKSIFTPGRSFFFQAGLYGGTIAGRLQLAGNKSIQTATLDSTLSGIQLAGSAVLQRIAGRNLSGTLGGEVRFKGSDGTLSAGLKIADSKIDIAGSVFGVEDLSFKDISADVTAAKKIIRVKTCTLRGNQMDGNFNGTIELREPIGRSALNLSGSIRLHDQFLADMGKKFPLALLSRKKTAGGLFPVQLGGTLDSPDFSLK